MYSPSIQKLIDLFSQFPTVGPRTASRFVFYLLKKPKKEIDQLVNSIINLKRQIKICSSCFNFFEVSNGKTNGLCEICADPNRDKSLLCVVANETDLMTIEKTKKYHGTYFVLGGTISALRKVDIEKLRVGDLEKRIKNGPEIKEIILALNPTPDGQATSLYLQRLLKPYNKKITQLGRGLPLGSELEYADQESLTWAITERKEIKSNE